MTQYLLLIHGNTTSESAPEEWDSFFTAASESGLFKGGSEIGDRICLGNNEPEKTSAHIVGFMRFDSDDRKKIEDLLAIHPVVLRGGTVELCEMPRSG